MSNIFLLLINGFISHSGNQNSSNFQQMTNDAQPMTA